MKRSCLESNGRVSRKRWTPLPDSGQPSVSAAMNAPLSPPPFEIIDFERVEGTECPCGIAKRALADASDVPFTLHVTDIAHDAHTHYHRRLTEVYYFLECAPGAQIELDGTLFKVRPGMAVVIRPGTRHRAVGKMRVLIVVHPKFDPADEWLDEESIESSLPAVRDTE